MAELQVRDVRSGCLIHMGGCQNDGPFLGPHYNTAPNI